MSSLSPNHVQLEFPKRAYLHAHECIQGREFVLQRVTRVRNDDAPLDGRQAGNSVKSCLRAFFPARLAASTVS
jgi:hypothetical protein